jgi:hypothetical protein
MAKFYKDADRLMALQIIAIACLFLGAMATIIFSGYRLRIGVYHPMSLAFDSLAA